jgi:SpoVK/Ycf46/Vps4 family AAA+-type ATPase
MYFSGAAASMTKAGQREIMKKREAIEKELSQIPGWQLVHNKKGILGPMERLLDRDESILSLLDGLYFDGKIAEQEKEVSGVLLLTGKRILFISGEGKSGLFNEIPISDLRGIARNKKASFHELTVRGKTQVMGLKIFAGSSSAKTFMDAVADITGGRIEQRESDTARLVEDINRSFETLTRLNREIGQDLGRQMERPASGDASAAGISPFLFGEAAEIRGTLGDYLVMQNLPELAASIRDDILIITSLLMDPGKGLSDTERVFIALVMIPLMERESWRYGNVAKTIGTAKEYPREITGDCVGYITSLDPYITSAGKKPDLNGGSLKSMTLMRRHDFENGSNHGDRLGTALYNFSQCLAKADGTISPDEEERLKEIHRLILQRDAAAESAAAAAREGEKVETLEEVMEKINALVGMKAIKDEINSLVNLIKVQKRRLELNLPATPVSLHSVFYGPPGTGKTTIARLLGKVFRALGMIRKGQLIETDRAGLVAGYVGQTAINVDAVVQKALDGVLFIDEAYSLVPDNAGSDFGREAIDTILKRMEDYRDRLVVIVAGYTDEMERFIDSNPGLKSRFNRYFYFDHYSPEDLYRIFEIFIRNASFVPDEKAVAKLKLLLAAMHKKRDRAFGNGRLVRNIFEKTVERQANRIAGITPLTGEVLCAIIEADIPDEGEASPGARDRRLST